MAIHDGGSAYPTDAFIDKGKPAFPTKGMSKLEVYAKAAMEGLCVETSETEFSGTCWSDGTLRPSVVTAIATAAFDLAEAMVAEYERRKDLTPEAIP